jgi:DNA-binding transcriptional LysR family regulator
VTARAIRPNLPALICAPDDPLAGSTVAPRAVAGRPWLLREPGSGTRALNEEYLAAQELRVPTLTVGSNGAIKQAVRAGLGVSLVSRDAVAEELAGGLLAAIGLDPAPAPRDWHVMRSRVGPVRPVVAEFLAFLR